MAKRRGNGEGSIFYSESRKQWIGEIYLGVNSNGKPYKPKVYGKTQKEARKKLNDFIANHTAGNSPIPEKITLEHYITTWLKIKKKNVKPRTYEAYEQICKTHINPALGSILLQKLSVQQVNNFIDTKLNCGLKSTTVIKIKTVLNNILQEAVKEELINRNVVANSRSVKKLRSIPTLPTAEQIKVMLNKAMEYRSKKGDKMKFLYHAILLAASTGIRRGELLALRFRNFDFQNNTIRIVENLVAVTKTDDVTNSLQFGSPKSQSSIRAISVHPDVMSEFKIYQGTANDDDLVFRTKNNTPISPRNFIRAFHILLEDTGLEGFNWHLFRHYHATDLLSNKTNAKIVSSRLGHSDIGITLNLYAHVLPADDIGAAANINQHIL